MKAPDPILKCLSSILTEGILRIRSAGFRGDASRCAVEADHIHNIPAMLSDFQWELLSYYWEVQRPGYIDAVDGINLSEFEPYWNGIEEALRRSGRQSPVVESEGSNSDELTGRN